MRAALVAALFDAGTHALGIRAPGYKPRDIDVTVDGAANRETVLLDPAP